MKKEMVKPAMKLNMFTYLRAVKADARGARRFLIGCGFDARSFDAVEKRALEAKTVRKMRGGWVELTERGEAWLRDRGKTA